MSDVCDFKGQLRGEVEAMRAETAEQFRQVQGRYQTSLEVSRRVRVALRPRVEALGEALPGATPAVSPAGPPPVRGARPDCLAPRHVERREGRGMVRQEGARVHEKLRQHIFQPFLSEGAGGPGTSAAWRPSRSRCYWALLDLEPAWRPCVVTSLLILIQVVTNNFAEPTLTGKAVDLSPS